ncbi:MAG: NifB/NifX family molybdenum-iron cluster-binding protein [Acidobacteriaceae bacterium]
MRIAIPHWQGRIAPVFDVAGRLLLIDAENGLEVSRQERVLLKTTFSDRAAELVSFEANVLLCGAISAPLQRKLLASGLKVIAFVCGTVDEVLAAYLRGSLADPAFAMPGCHRWRWRGGEDALPAEFGSGRGSGGGSSRGRRPATGTGSVKLRGVGWDESQVCPKCGEAVRLLTGQRRRERLCPRCGARMTPF